LELENRLKLCENELKKVKSDKEAFTEKIHSLENEILSLNDIKGNLENKLLESERLNAEQSGKIVKFLIEKISEGF
jgi:hypothetical protein